MDKRECAFRRLLKEKRMENKFGKVSDISLTAAWKEGRTVLEDVSFTAPFKIMYPFSSENGLMRIMLLTASAGLMAGDTQHIRIDVRDSGRMSFESQAYEKIHKMETGSASRRAVIKVGKNAYLEYIPHPAIPFKDSAFESSVDVELEDESSAFLFREIISCGRAARKEEFEYRYFRSLINVRKGGKHIYRDNTRYEPEWFDMSGMGMYEGFTHMGSLLFFNIEKTEKWIGDVRSLIDSRSDMEGGVTRLASGDVLVRILGFQADEILEIFQKIQER